MCGDHDDCPDPIHPGRYLRWSHPPKGDPPKNDGLVCFPCMKLYKARFMIRFKSVKALRTKMAGDDDLKEQFKTLKEHCIAECLKVGGVEAIQSLLSVCLFLPSCGACLRSGNIRLQLECEVSGA